MGEMVRKFQSYLSPCLTIRTNQIKYENTQFQSYLSPCLTINETEAKVMLERLFQSYLSPCLTTSDPKMPRISIVVYFNPTLVRV